MLLAILTGVRVTELLTLTVGDVSLGHRRPHQGDGQGTETSHDHPHPRDRRGAPRMAQRTPRPARRPAVPDPPRTPLSRDAVELLVAKHTATAAADCPSLADKRVTPHTLRHYVDGGVMWPAAMFPLLGLSLSPVPAT